MKNLKVLFFALLCLSALSCDKENNLQTLATPHSSPSTTAQTPATSRNGDLWLPTGNCFSRIFSEDQKAIKAARDANNQAIKAHDAQRVAEDYLEDFFILTSTNGLFTGKDEVANIYQLVFDSRTDVIFVRTPTAITVNTDWNMASENGNWVGTWVVDGENIRVGGDYYAKWHKIDDTWKLRSEVYTQFNCRGEVVCQNQPNLK